MHVREHGEGTEEGWKMERRGRGFKHMRRPDDAFIIIFEI